MRRTGTATSYTFCFGPNIAGFYLFTSPCLTFPTLIIFPENKMTGGCVLLYKPNQVLTPRAARSQRVTTSNVRQTTSGLICPV